MSACGREPSITSHCSRAPAEGAFFIFDGIRRHPGEELKKADKDSDELQRAQFLDERARHVFETACVSGTAEDVTRGIMLTLNIFSGGSQTGALGQSVVVF